MKKKILGGVAVLVIAIIVAINISLVVNEKKYETSLTLSAMNAHAGWWDDLKEWWNSEVYTCIWDKCLIVVPYSYCAQGDNNAHCWECTDCM